MKQIIYGLIFIASITMLMTGCVKRGVIKEDIQIKEQLGEEIIEKPLRGETPNWVNETTILPNEAEKFGLSKENIYFVKFVEADSETAAQVGAEARAVADIAGSYESTIKGTKAWKEAEAKGVGTAQYVKGLASMAAENVNVHGITVKKTFTCKVMKKTEDANAVRLVQVGYKVYALVQMDEKEYKAGLKKAIDNEMKKFSGVSTVDAQQKLNLNKEITNEVNNQFQ
jgi:hypothetical protein